MTNTNRPITGFHTNPERINKDGRPQKEFSMTSALKEVMAEVNPATKIERYRMILRKAVDKAERGDNDMIKYLINRFEGTPTLRTDENITGNYSAMMVNISEAEVLEESYKQVAKDSNISVEDLKTLIKERI